MNGSPLASMTSERTMMLVMRNDGLAIAAVGVAVNLAATWPKKCSRLS
jgi:hypothetical protein